MGDIFGAIQLAIDIVTPLVAAEVTLHSGLKDDIKVIKNELQSISVFLKNAEKRPEEDDFAKDWVSRVRTLAYEIEDAIERYQLYLKENKFSKAKHYILRDVSNMATTIKSLRDRTSNIGEEKNRYRFGINNVTGGTQGNSQGILITSVFQCTINAGYQVQDDISKKKIVSLLGFQNVNGTPSTIAVVGMRGLGKTTVVRSVYYDSTVRPNFAHRAWVSMSECKKQGDIIRQMIEQFSYATNKIHSKTVLNSMDERSLLTLFQRYIEGKRYMVIFDNVHEGDIKLIGYIKCMLHSNKDHSKIIITTRYENIAHALIDGSTSRMYKLKPLPLEKGLELFRKKAFQSSNGRCPPELDKLAQAVVKKCGGLPPVLISVGSLLNTKGNDMSEWNKVRRSLGFFLDTDSQLSGVHKTFTLSYYDLPYYLKPCFLYFGMFPKGYHVSRMRLIRLWIAEGFIRKDGRSNLTLEEVAEEYISDLINMSMIEVKSSDSTGKVQTLGVISKFLYEMILAKLDELNFVKILSKKSSIGSEKSRRLSIHKNSNHNSKAPEFLDYITKNSSSIRSVFVEDVSPTIMGKVFNNKFFKSISFLKVLDLFNAPIDFVPNEIGMLLNLHYLSLRNTGVTTLPKTISKLENLQTLDLKQTCVAELPKEFISLVKLRHLLGYFYRYDITSDAHCMKINGVKIPEGLLAKTPELQKLAFLDLNVVHRTWAEELRSLTQLRKLGIIGLEMNDENALCSVIDGMEHIQAISIFSKSKAEKIDLRNVSSPPLMLKRLYLSGSLLAFPTWIKELKGLVKIRLRWSILHDDPLTTLQLLPNVVEVQLLEAFVGEHLTIASGGFGKLKVLHLLDLQHLKSFFIAKGALPQLEEMSIGESKYLQMPSGIKYLSTLTNLNFYNMPSYFTDGILQGKPHYSTVKHVPSVLFYNKDSNGCWQPYTLH